jgi:hypothetical protein
LQILAAVSNILAPARYHRIDSWHLEAQPTALHTVRDITPNALRAPEVILRGLWDEKVDIWIFGCLVCYAITYAITISSAAQADGYDFQVFEILVGRHLFEYVAYPKYNLDAPAGHLWQMMCFTGERFMPEQLDRSDLATQYFDSTCLSSLITILALCIYTTEFQVTSSLTHPTSKTHLPHFSAITRF